MGRGIDDRYQNFELTHKIIGAAFEVQNSLGSGHREKYYQLAMAKEFKRRGLEFIEQINVDLRYKREKIGRRVFDFIVGEKVVVELKVGLYLAKSEFDQMLDYLNISGLEVGLLILFSNKGVRIRRVVNLK